MSLLRQPADGSNMTASSRVKNVRQVLLRGGKEKKIAGTKWAIVQHFAADILQKFSNQLCRVGPALSLRGIAPSLRHFRSHIKPVNPRASKFVTKENSRRCSPSADKSPVS